VSGLYYASLHWADPEGSFQDAYEADYFGYMRVPIEVEDLVGYATVTFPVGYGSGKQITHFGVGTSKQGPGYLIDGGHVTPNITPGQWVMPRLTLNGDAITRICREKFA
jgi:hypothetical protein